MFFLLVLFVYTTIKSVLLASRAANKARAGHWGFCRILEQFSDFEFFLLPSKVHTRPSTTAHGASPRTQTVGHIKTQKGEIKDMETIGFIFGMMGFIFGITAMSQVAELQKEVEELRSQIDPKVEA